MRSVKEIIAEFAGADPDPDGFADDIIRQLEIDGYHIVPINDRAPTKNEAEVVA